MGMHSFQLNQWTSAKISNRKGFAASAPVALAQLGLLLFLLTPGVQAGSAPAAMTEEDTQKLEWQIVMQPDQEWEKNSLANPWVIYEDGQYRMWYSFGRNFPRYETSGGGIAYVESIDGIHWTDKQRLIRATENYDSSYAIWFPIVLKVGNEYWMYTTHCYYTEAGEWSSYIVRRTSPDGIHWGAFQTVFDGTGKQLWEFYNFEGRYVYPEPSGGYRLFYSVMFKTSFVPPHSYLATAYSEDGVHWGDRKQLLDNIGQPFLTSTSGLPTIILPREGGGYRLIYSNRQDQLVAAESDDGIRWEGITDFYGSVSNIGNILATPGVSANGNNSVIAPDGKEYLYTYGPDGIGRAWLRIVPPLNVDFSAYIEPCEPRTLDNLECVTQVNNLGGYSEFDLSYRWFRNGAELTEGMEVSGEFFPVTGASLSRHFTEHNETWYCTARITDGTSWLEAIAKPVTIRNTPPPAPVFKIIPENPRPWDGLCVDIQQYSVDPDGDDVGYEIRWYRSQDGGATFVYKQEISGIAPLGTCFPSAFLADGDVWRAEVIPFELSPVKSGKLSGQSALGNSPVARVEGEITWDQVVVSQDNFRPEVRVTLPGDADVLAWGPTEVAWQSEDANGDPVTVYLFYAEQKSKGSLAAIAGNLPETGNLLWQPPKDNPVLDLSGDGALGFEDLWLLSSKWMYEPETAAEYYIFARGIDSVGAVGEAFSVGRVVVPGELPGTPAGLVELLRNWRNGDQ